MSEQMTTRPKITYAHEITPQRQRWAYAPGGHGLVPLGTGSIFAGAGGEGKSTFALDIAAKLTRGELPGDLHGQKHRVIIFGPEDDWPTVMVPRLVAAGADLRGIAQVQGETTIDEVTRERELKFPLDLGVLRQAVATTGAKMVIVDPAPSLMDGDMNKVQDVRRSYEPLMALAQQNDLAVVLINHFGKGAGNVGAKLSGSHAWRDLTRSYLAFATDEETGERVVSQDKNNYGPDRGSWKFTLESTDVPVEGGTTDVARVNFLGESSVTVGEIINRQSVGDDDDEDRNETDRWLIEVLTEAGGSMPVKDIKAAARTAGYEFKTLQNRRPRVSNPKITTGRNGFGKGSVPFWEIVPESDIDPGQNHIGPHTSLHSHTQGPMGSMEEKPGPMENPSPGAGPKGATTVTSDTSANVADVAHMAEGTEAATPGGAEPSNGTEPDLQQVLDLWPIGTADLAERTGWSTQRSGQLVQTVQKMEAQK